ncbi:MAG: hypothetical protein EXR03_10500 [Pseudolabrys sp.]|nr:hypothetical protein [Pseudolabrys sp.]
MIELAARTKKRKTADAIDAKPMGAGLVTSHPKPAKRLNAKERAKARFKDKSSAEDGTTPTMTAKAKSKTETKSKNSKAAVAAT